jgi:hypothetical protein
MKLRLALRSVLRAPGFASFSVLVMALGNGLTTVAFFVLNAVLLQPLDLPSPDRLVRIHPVFKKSGRLVPNVPGLDFRDLRDRAEAFSAMAAYWSGRTTILVGGTSGAGALHGGLAWLAQDARCAASDWPRAFFEWYR